MRKTSSPCLYSEFYRKYIWLKLGEKHYKNLLFSHEYIFFYTRNLYKKCPCINTVTLHEYSLSISADGQVAVKSFLRRRSCLTLTTDLWIPHDQLILGPGFDALCLVCDIHKICLTPVKNLRRCKIHFTFILLTIIDRLLLKFRIKVISSHMWIRPETKKLSNDSGRSNV